MFFCVTLCQDLKKVDLLIERYISNPVKLFIWHVIEILELNSFKFWKFLKKNLIVFVMIQALERYWMIQSII